MSMESSTGHRLMNILIADDEARYRVMMGHLFEKWPEHQLTLAEDGNEAWTLLDDPKRWFDVVFLDLNMPKSGGLDVLRRLRESPLHKSVEPVICTASNDRETIKQAIALGVRHYIVKPWTEAQIADKLRQIAAKRAA
ncbi:response regulator [Oleiharenicola lentus]|uniref:Response regulator n=2 Tax=Oleiharenicola lentus TaxID=2508720 RepID=A0A4Q1CB01_9BACT|nr:response regulator [Oleiharenicola lentus]